jgi:hypothetical protein
VKTNVSFAVSHEKPDRICPGFCFITDRAKFSAVRSTVHSGGSGKWRILESDTFIHVVEAPAGDPGLENVFAELEKAGWKPFVGEDVPIELTPGYLFVRRKRAYSDTELSRANYLSLVEWGAEEPVFYLSVLEGGTYVAQVTAARWKSRLGRIEVLYSPPFVRDDLRQELLDAGLEGLEFLPLRWDQPKKVKAVFWQMSSHVTMPPCLLSLVRITSFNYLFYDDGGHHPQELVFREAQVAAMEPFDAALTAEDVFGVSNSWNRKLVVSQRFRTVCRELKLKNVTFAPVRLVSDDWQRPLTDHDRFARGELR